MSYESLHNNSTKNIYKWLANSSTDEEVFPGTYAPCRSYDIDVSGRLIPSWLVLIVIIITIVILICMEYKAHDCIPGKMCKNSAPKPNEMDDNLEYIDKIGEMVRNNYNYIIWRQSLIVALLAPLLIVYFLKGRVPTLLEWFIVGIIIFVITYATYSWIWAHFFYPNGREIEKSLTELRDRLNNTNNF